MRTRRRPLPRQRPRLLLLLLLHRQKALARAVAWVHTWGTWVVGGVKGEG